MVAFYFILGSNIQPIYFTWKTVIANGKMERWKTQIIKFLFHLRSTQVKKKQNMQEQKK